MSGDQFFVMKDIELAWFNFERELLGGVERRHRVAVGLKDDAAAAIGAHGADDCAVVGHDWQRFQERLFLRE